MHDQVAPRRITCSCHRNLAFPNEHQQLSRRTTRLWQMRSSKVEDFRFRHLLASSVGLRAHRIGGFYEGSPTAREAVFALKPSAKGEFGSRPGTHTRDSWRLCRTAL